MGSIFVKVMISGLKQEKKINLLKSEKAKESESIMLVNGKIGHGGSIFYSLAIC